MRDRTARQANPAHLCAAADFFVACLPAV